MTEETQETEASTADIGDAFSEPEAEEPETEEEAKAEIPEESDTAEEETEEEKGEETSESPSQPSQVPIAALTAERRKRQAAEKKLQEIEEDIPDPVENPKEYAEFVRNASSTNELQTRITISRDVLAEIDPDFNKYEQAFMGAVSKVQDNDGKQEISIVNQDLYNQFIEAPNPAKFARDMGKEILEYQERSSPDYEQKLREKILAELKAEQSLPDVTEATAAGSNSEPEEKPADLNSVFDGSPL